MKNSVEGWIHSSLQDYFLQKHEVLLNIKKEKKTALGSKDSLKTHGTQTEWIPSVSPPHDSICHSHTQPTSLWIPISAVWIWFAFQQHVLSRYVQPSLNQRNPTNQWIYTQLLKNSTFFFPQTACNCHPLSNLSCFESKKRTQQPENRITK